MLAYSIIEEPANFPTLLAIQAAYRQLRYVVSSDSACDPTLPMYADIYIVTDIFTTPVATYYKTLSSYSVDGTTGILSGNGLYTFDIQDALQTCIQTFIPSIPISDIEAADSIQSFADVFVKVYFRGSSVVSGVLVPQSPVPVQGTLTTPPTSPLTGLISDVFLCSAASILPGWGNNILANDFEGALAAKQLIPVELLPETRIYALSNLPLGIFGVNALDPDTAIALPVYKQDCGGFPILIANFGISGSLSLYHRNVMVQLIYSVPNGTIFAPPAGYNGILPLTSFDFIGPGTYYLPQGLQEIAAAVGSSYMTQFLNPANNYYYQIALYDVDAGSYAFFTPWYKFQTSAIEETRICFQNTYGVFEWVSFVRSGEKFTVTSAEQLVPYTQQISPATNAQNVGHQRNNITAQDTIALTAVFPEPLMNWVKEMFMSPRVFIQNKDNTLKPMKIIDDSIDSRKSVKDGRISYEVTLQMMPAWDYITLRN